MPEPTTEIKYACAGPRVEGGGRVPCGEDTTALILAVPQDGETYVVACPACGTETKVLRTPPD